MLVHHSKKMPASNRPLRIDWTAQKVSDWLYGCQCGSLADFDSLRGH